MKRPTVLLKIVLLMTFTISLSACSGGTGSSSFGLPTGDGGGSGGGGDVAGTSDGVSSSSNFYVGVDVAVNSLAHVHQNGSFSTGCVVTPTDPYSSLTCIIDLPEPELMFNGLSLKYNVPVGLCRYLRRKSYWFYNKEVGVGPSSISIARVFSADNSLVSATCSVNGSAPGVCNGFSEVSINNVPTPPEISCVYDRSATAGGANCCTGNVSINVADTDANGNVSTSLTQKAWASDIRSCLSGPGATDWDFQNSFGIPIGVIDNARFGVSTTYDVKPIRDKHDTFYSLPIANFFTTATHVHSGFGPALGGGSNRTSSRPYFLDPIDDRDGTIFPEDATQATTSNYLVPANPTYSFDCLDEAFEVKHEINVRVREWDTYADFVTYISTAGVTTNPDRGSDIEGTGCAGISGYCNDFFDLDDFKNIIGASYDTSLGSIPLRDSYFPNY